MSRQNRQAGFTLIELVMVIVVLGILAAFALPRFADLSGDAEQAATEGARGAVKAAAGIAHSKWLVADGQPATISLEGASIGMVNGYPAANQISAAAQLEDFVVNVSGSTATILEANQNCQFDYVEAPSVGATPSIGAVTAATGSTCP